MPVGPAAPVAGCSVPDAASDAAGVLTRAIAAAGAEPGAVDGVLGVAVTTARAITPATAGTAAVPVLAGLAGAASGSGAFVCGNVCRAIGAASPAALSVAADSFIRISGLAGVPRKNVIDRVAAVASGGKESVLDDP